MISGEKQMELRARFNPEGSELRAMQRGMLDILIYFDEFCRKHGIRYWLSSGTLLGAVRHRGFIPWDDDMDIEMLQEDYDKLSGLRKEFENDRFVLQDHCSDKEYISPSPKLRDKHSHIKEIHNRDKGYKYGGLFIDIFIRRHTSFATSRLSHIMQYGSYAVSCMQNDAVRKFMKTFCYHAMHYVFFPILRGMDILLADKHAYRYNLGAGFYDAIPGGVLLSVSEVEFEGHKFPAPHDCDAYLKILYGDYDKLPNIEDIRIHTVR